MIEVYYITILIVGSVIYTATIGSTIWAFITRHQYVEEFAALAIGATFIYLFAMALLGNAWNATQEVIHG